MVSNLIWFLSIDMAKHQNFRSTQSAILPKADIYYEKSQQGKRRAQKSQQKFHFFKF